MNKLNKTYESVDVVEEISDEVGISETQRPEISDEASISETQTPETTDEVIISETQTTETENNESDLDEMSSDEAEIMFIPNEVIDIIKNREEISFEKLIEDTHVNTNTFVLEEDDIFYDAEEYITEEELSTDSPIYPGHTLTVKTSILLIWLFAITHSLTAQQLSDLLSLITVHMLSSHPCMSSFYRFKRFFQHSESPLVKHYYCPSCYAELAGNEKECTNEACKMHFSDASPQDYFMELPVKEQLDGLFSRKEFIDGLSHRQSRVKRSKANIEDVYDGLSYKRLSRDGGPLHEDNKYNISFIFHTDGIPVFKSSKTSMWPIFLMVNELPYNMRKNRNNMILCGLWYGKNKPLMNLFCSPLHHTLFELEKGVNTRTYDGNLINVHGYLFCITCDIPARNGVLNMNQHNGASCCPKCCETGQNFRTAKGGNVRTFPFNTEEPLGRRRTQEETLSDAEKASATKSIVNGIKGPSFLMFCPKFDVVAGTGIDYMHLIFLGVVRLLLNLWFNVANTLQEFSIYKYVEVVDDRLLKIKPSHFITRPPRTISDDLKFWKAAELRSWFFYYSIPCVMDLMKPRHFYHYCCLVEGIFLLNQVSISEEDIANSERLLKYFVFMMPGLYGERYMTINVHSLLHLPQTVRELGPLWAISCFPFESASGDLLKLFHGTQYIDAQIINAVHVYHMLPSLTQTIAEESPAYPLVASLLKQKRTKWQGRFWLCGKGHPKVVPRDIECLITGIFSLPVHSCDLLFYKRATIRGIMYHSADYTRAFTRNSFTVKFMDDKNNMKFGSIMWFAELKEEFLKNCRDDVKAMSKIACVALLRPVDLKIFDMNHDSIMPDEFVASNFMDLKLKNIHFVEPSNDICIIRIQSVVDLCMYVNSAKCAVVMEEPNHYEINL